MSKYFTGYISLSGVHIVDGIKNPIIPLTEIKKGVVALRWLGFKDDDAGVGILNRKIYEKEMILNITEKEGIISYDPPLPPNFFNKISPNAISALNSYIERHHSSD